jgi:hypothetical protein
MSYLTNLKLKPRTSSFRFFSKTFDTSLDINLEDFKKTPSLQTIRNKPADINIENFDLDTIVLPSQSQFIENSLDNETEDLKELEFFIEDENPIFLFNESLPSDSEDIYKEENYEIPTFNRKKAVEDEIIIDSMRIKNTIIDCIDSSSYLINSLNFENKLINYISPVQTNFDYNEELYHHNLAYSFQNFIKSDCTIDSSISMFVQKPGIIKKTYDIFKISLNNIVLTKMYYFNNFIKNPNWYQSFIYDSLTDEKFYFIPSIFYHKPTGRVFFNNTAQDINKFIHDYVIPEKIKNNIQNNNNILIEMYNEILEAQDNNLIITEDEALITALMRGVTEEDSLLEFIIDSDNNDDDN